MPYTEAIESAAAALRRAWGTPVDLRLVDVVVDYSGRYPWQAGGALSVRGKEGA